MPGSIQASHSSAGSGSKSPASAIERHIKVGVFGLGYVSVDSWLNNMACTW